MACAAGSNVVGVRDGYHGGTLTRIRLCAVPNLRSASEESTPGTSYYVSGANHLALVNSRISAATITMVNAARNAGLTPSAISSFRTMAHQQSLCSQNTACTKKDYRYVARPGYSNHQMGLSIDFAGTNVGFVGEKRQRLTVSFDSTLLCAPGCVAEF